jgi:LmbE family N-acetylglucosaminyl deacetylase
MKKLGCTVLLALALSISSAADNRNVYPIAEERGTAGTLAALEALPVHVRVLYTIAHPDDEGAGTLVWLARKAHADTALFSLTRGDGGQNVLGSEKYEAMGLVRTGELLEACRLYGVEPYFSTVFEFGFSKSAAETLEKWGHEATLEEVVRFIRMWRPQVLISRFQGTGGDGHGHHQAAGILSVEAFRAAGDPAKFPRQIEEGLPAWQPQKLYESARGGAGLQIPVGDYDPVLGRSYREIGAQGYSKHRSQGNGAALALPGQAYDGLKLVQTVPGITGSDQSLFDGIDTSLTSILDMVGPERPALQALEPELKAAAQAAAEAISAFDPKHPEKSTPAAARGAGNLAQALALAERSSASKPARKIVAEALRRKLHDFHEAVSAALGIRLIATTEDASGAPGQKAEVNAVLFDRGTLPVIMKSLQVTAPEGWAVAAESQAPAQVEAGKSVQRRFSVEIPQGAAVTEPFWYRESRDDTRYRTRPTPNIFAPFDPPVLKAEAGYDFGGAEIRISEPVRAQAGDPLRGSDFVDFQVVPPLSVSLNPDIAIVPLSAAKQTREFQVSLLGNEPSGISGSVQLELPAGWSVEPPEGSFSTARKGESVKVRFRISIPAGTKTGNYPVSALARAGGREYRRGYKVISYPENWTRNLYSPASSSVEVFDLKIAPQLTVGYVMGSGDEVPRALEQMVKVEMLSANDLAFGDLGRFTAIVTGIRAYNVNNDLKTNNQRLLRYVEQGGTLIVQYNTPGRGSSPFPYGPYPMTISAEDRITVEESPLRILDPQNPVFSTPNKITEADFGGWVQERGLYFMNSWDPKYTALLSGSDPGEPPKNGGMLITRYGKGYYIYTSYVWFRELPAGVPGAFRLFANMLSAGRNN